jgi:hypothetical protein
LHPLRILPALALLAALLAGGVSVRAAEPSAKDLYKRGRKFEKQKDYASAYLMYSQAAAADPSKTEYWRRAQALQRKAMSAAKVMPAIDGSLAALVPQTSLPVSRASAQEVAEALRPQPPMEIQADSVVRDFDLNGDRRRLWEEVLKAYGLDAIFDGDFEAGTPMRFRLQGAKYREALHALMSATGTFFVPISEKLVMVVRDTEQKRKEVENTVALTVPIPDPFTVQEAQELGRSVQQVMEIQRFAIDSTQRVAIFRDRVSKARPAQLLFQQLMRGKAQVLFEVQLLSAAKTSTIGIGLNLATSFPLTPLTAARPLSALLTNFALGIGNANLVARATKSDGRLLYRAELRAGDGQPAQLHVGEKYPIMTLAYIGNVDPGNEGEVFRPPPSFNFEDLGLVLKVTPKVHDREEVTLDLETEFKVLTGASLNGIPVVSNRKFATRARLKFDEAAVLSGLVTRNDFRTLSGPAGLINVPVLGPILGQSDWSKDDVQILLTIRPILLRLPPTEMSTREIWVGSETRPRIPL